MTIDELKNLDTSKFTRAADGWSAVSNRAAASRGRVDNEMLGKLRGTQEGDAAKAALSDLDQLSANYRYIHSECGLIRTALSGLAEELAAPQRKLKQALEEAQSLKFTVKSDGSVEYPKTASTPAPLVPTPAAPGAMPSLLKPDSTPDPNQAKAQDIANRIGEALKEATEIDGRYARALANLNTDGNLKNTDLKDVASDVRDVRAAAGKHFSDSKIPKGKSPKENAQWWKNLPQAERDEYTALYPASIGALDGLPAAVRDEANRIVLTDARAQVEAEYNALTAHPPTHYRKRMNARFGRRTGPEEETPEWKRWESEREELKKRMGALDSISSRFGKPGQPEAYLLSFDTEKLGHAALSIGNPDTADNVAAYVPGTYAKLDGISGDIDRAERLYGAARRAAPGSTTASLVWVGYDAPQDILLEATQEKYANHAKGSLDRFVTGLDEARQGGPANVTLIGHSYGTLVVGKAMAENHDLPVNHAVMVASPGVGVDHARELGIPAKDVWAATASNDLINLAPSPRSLLMPSIFGPLFDDHSIMYGNDPTSDEFGGSTFHVADGKAPLTHGELLPAHSQYWEGESLIHLGNIVAKGKS
ncbi:alpha/beta hydrolase [Streptomyces cinnamoneus]|uniref:alpha/beta hydrolase n=1 Tax=Streptomyces cinnamoneus TaxID=53446 RepID=UPI0034433885